MPVVTRLVNATLVKSCAVLATACIVYLFFIGMLGWSGASVGCTVGVQGAGWVRGMYKVNRRDLVHWQQGSRQGRVHWLQARGVGNSRGQGQWGVLLGCMRGVV